MSNTKTNAKEIAKFKHEEKFKYELTKLQVELTKLQEHIKNTNQKVLFIFEGRDASGKGSVIKTLTQYLNPRFVKTVALGVPTQKEKTQWYFQRYVAHLPSAGEMILFDRSWYNRAMVEPVMGFCTEDEHKRFLKDAPLFEGLIKNSGIKIFKFYFSIKKKTQQERFHERETNTLKHYKLSPVDKKAQAKWDDFSTVTRKMFKKTNTKDNPWKIIVTDGKKRAKINCLKYILNQFDYRYKDADTIANIDTSIVKDVK